MTVMLANAPMPTCSPRSLTTFNSFRKLALCPSPPPQACMWLQKSVLGNDIPYTTNSESKNCRCSPWSSIFRNDVSVNGPRPSSISSITCAQLSNSRLNALLHSSSLNPPSANSVVPFLCECCTDPIDSSKLAKRTLPDVKNSLSFAVCCLPAAVSIRLNRRIASRYWGSKQQTGAKNVFQGKVDCGSSEHEEQTNLKARSLFGGASPTTRSAPFDKNWTEMKSESKEFESDERKWSRNGVAANEDSSRVGTRGAIKGNQDNDIVGGRRREAFELWAVEKLKEDGPSALPTIEEMRQTYAPGSPRLDPRIALNEIEWQRDLSVEGNNDKYNHAVSATIPGLPSAGTRTERVRNLEGGQRESPGNRGEASSSEFVARTSNRFESWSPNQTSFSRYESNVASRKGVKFSTEATVKASGENSTLDAADLQPLLVKRNTKFPVNWHGKAGSVMLVDKPEGWTSFAVCAKLRYLLKIQKVGHAGTLDPMATGLLIVCLGKATKLADSYQAMTKVYSGTIRLGELTPSLDSFTEVSNVMPWEHVTDEELEQAKHDFIGDIFQTPPMYSAIKVKGERLYKKARRGEEIEIPARLVTVTEFQLARSSQDRQNIHFKVTCSKGTYVRSLCADLARALGSCAHLTVLRREKIGKYSVKDAWPVLEFVEQCSLLSNNIAIKAKS